MPANENGTSEFDYLISSDSHVIEPRDLWTTRLPANLRERISESPMRFDDKPVVTEPKDRLGVMKEDSVSMEVLFPTYGLVHFGLEDPILQEACFRVFNDWVVATMTHGPLRGQ